MRVVLDGRLWLGNAGDLRDPTVLDRQGIRAVVQVALEERPPQLPRELLCCHFPIVDGENEPSVVAVALEAAAALVRTATPTLICCGAGMSRSPAIAAGALAIATEADPDGCLMQIISGQPHDVSPALWSGILSYLHSRQGGANSPNRGQA